METRYGYQHEKGGFDRNMLLLKEKRLEKNLSQKELAELSHIPQQSISAYESGSRMPAADVLHLLAMALDTTMDELYRPDERGRCS